MENTKVTESKKRVEEMAKAATMFMKDECERRIALGEDSQDVFFDSIAAVMILAVTAAVTTGVPLEGLVRMYTLAEQNPGNKPDEVAVDWKKSEQN